MAETPVAPLEPPMGLTAGTTLVTGKVVLVIGWASTAVAVALTPEDC